MLCVKPLHMWTKWPKRFDWFVSLENGQISHISLFAHLCSNYRFIKVWCSFHDMPPETIFIRIHLSNWFEWKILSILFSTPDRIAIQTLSIFSLDPIRIYFSPDLVHIGLSDFPCRDSTEIVYVITEGISHSLFELEICFLLHFVCRVRTNSMLRILFCSCSCVCLSWIMRHLQCDRSHKSRAVTKFKYRTWREQTTDDDPN